MTRFRDYAVWAVSKRIYVRCHLAVAASGGFAILLALAVATGTSPLWYAILIVPLAFVAGLNAAVMCVEWVDHLIDREMDAA